jgi:DNA-binding transcriptional LysR family regulator
MLMLSPQRLKVLSAVAAHGSFSEAADELSYSQSAVSQAVAALEAQTGLSLLERSRKGVRPTAAGQDLIDHSVGILARLQAAEDSLAALAGLRGGRLRMASFATAGATLMPLAIATFRAAHPDVELHLAEGEPAETVPQLQNGEVDLALLFEFDGASERIEAELDRTFLLRDPMHLALPAGHPLASRRRIGLADLHDQSWVQTSAESACARHVVSSCLAAGFSPRVAFESDDYQTVQGLVAAGVGVALIPQLALRGVRSDVIVRRLDEGIAARTVVAATAERVPSPAAARMVGVLRDVTGRFDVTQPWDRTALPSAD